MAVRPPGGGNDEPDAIEFGIAALDARLDETDLSFPATDQEVLEALDSTTIPYDGSGNTLDLAEAFDRLDTDTFETRTELLDELYPAFEYKRQHGGVPVFQRLRELLPF